MEVDRQRRRLCAAGAAAGALAASLGGCTRQFHAADITGVAYGSDFHLFDTEGRPRQLADFRGKAILLFFGFTHCPDFCPTVLARSAEALQVLGRDAQRVRVLFVTLDPERDSPALLREYVRSFDPGFVALYGDVATTEQTATDFKIFYRKVALAGGYTIDHTTITYAYDPHGRLRLAIGAANSAASVAEDLRLLLREA